MRKIILYIASSLNGRIASEDGGVSWLDQIQHPEGEDYGYSLLQSRIDRTIQGYSTYQQVMEWDIPFPYPHTTNYVLSRSEREDTEHVQFITSDHIERIRQLKSVGEKDIWLIGGGQINTFLFNAGLIDELIVHIMPMVLEGGIALFEGMPDRKPLKLLESKSYSSGVVEMKYTVGSDH